WYSGDVTIQWTCSDATSGLDGTCPVDSTIIGEGGNLSASATVSDLAGNSTTMTVDHIQIDRTAPATSASITGNLHNGWYNATIQIALTATDNLSGVDATYYSIDGGAPQAYSGQVSFGSEGTHTLTYWSVDKAGNVEDKTGNSITLKIDTTAPTLSGTPTTQPNGNGWYSGDVTITWTCADTGSGLDGTCPADSTISGEGDNLGASASISDLAGNSITTTVDHIQIDRTAPSTTASVPDAPASGWYTDDVPVTLTGHDSLSGVAATYYSVDGGAAQLYSGPFSFGLEGTHSISFWSEDKAGNAETPGSPLTLEIDKTAPTTTVINPISPASGWFVTSGISFAFQATDNASGIAATYYTIDGGAPQTYGQPFTANLSDGSHLITYWSVDLAGNVETHATTNTVQVNVDTTPPTITGSQSPVANGFGWNNTDVSVTFTCGDAAPGSGLQTGVAGCSGDTTLTNEGADQMVRGNAVDVAGNTSSTDFGPVNIDKTVPTLSGAATTNPNAFSWYKGDVKIHWTGQDGLSGIDPATQPVDSVITGEGANLGAGPVSISDKAGNAGSGSVSGIKIDRTAPAIGGATVNDDGTPRSPNGAGWFNSAVRVRFSCSDALSGVQECASDVVLSTDGANQSASGSASDKADNSASATVSGINIDSQAPQTSANNQCDSKNGWCKGQTATVVLTATDQLGLSGVKEIHYFVNGGPEKIASGASVNVNVPLAAKSGIATVEYFAVDNAGNGEAKTGVSLKYDNIAPSVTHTLNPPANAAGWNNADVTVHFAATDDDGGSGVDPATVTQDQTISSETTGQVVNGSASDLAGNLGTDSVTVKLDKTAPTISGTATTSPNAGGWYNGPVTVHFTCAEQGAVQSGVATCPADVVLSGDGANQSASGTASDKAGNTASATVSGINIDSTKPTINSISVVNGAIYTLGDPATPSGQLSCSAGDGGSGVASCTVSVTGGNANGVGTFSYTATATDNAGNTATLTGSYKIIYRWDGFLQPINDTAHQVGTTTSIFKGGSTVPVKFQLKKADGTIIQSNTTPQWLTPAKGSATTAPVDETVYSDPATSGSTYRYDSTAQQYIYNWGTAKNQAGYYWRIGVQLDDGQIYYVNIGLR
ncbi:MAG TPA: PxKF domain-containing protein, partial [Nitrolancea sp.]|nr:PxKF domain-containing protein [Nitrolancea sp.]